MYLLLQPATMVYYAASSLLAYYVHNSELRAQKWKNDYFWVISYNSEFRAQSRQNRDTTQSSELRTQTSRQTAVPDSLEKHMIQP